MVSKDLSLLKAIGAEGIFVNIKRGRRERGAAQLNVASALVAESLTVTAQSVRDPYHILTRKWKAKVAAEEKEGGGGDKHMTEVEILLEELQELESESEKVAEQHNEAKKAAAYFPKPIFTTTPTHCSLEFPQIMAVCQLLI